MAYAAILISGGFSSAHGQTARPPAEEVLFGDAAPALTRPQFVAEVNAPPLTGLFGAPSVAGRVGVFVPPLRTTFYVGGNTPYDLSDLATESLFSNGDAFDAHLEYLVYAEARVHLSGRRYTGFYVEAGVGYEAFELRPRGTGRDGAASTDLANTVENAFVGISPGYATHLFGDLVTLTAGARVVFLVGGSDDEVVGDVPVDYSWGFVSPELRVGVRL